MKNKLELSRSASVGIVGGTGIGGAIGILFVWVLERWLGETLPSEVASAISALWVGIVAALASYLTSDKGTASDGVL